MRTIVCALVVAYALTNYYKDFTYEVEILPRPSICRID